MTTPTPDTAAAVRELRARGFAVCKPDPAEKRPTYPGWGTRSLDPADFGPADQVGILGGPLSDGSLPGNALVIIDLDTAEAVALADDYLPPTGMADGRAGKPRSHRYYLTPSDAIPGWAESAAEQSAAAAREATGHPGPFKKAFAHRGAGGRVIDFIGTGGQAVCPPSVWRSEDGTRTEAREWDGGAPGEPAVVPFLELWAAACELASACGAEVPRVVPAAPGAGSGAGRPDVVRRAVAYLAKCPPAVEGAGGHKTTFAVARAVVYGFDLGPEEGCRVLSEHWNETCKPPWSERELRHKCEDADRVPFGKPRGYLRDAERGAAPRPEGRRPGGEAYPQPADGELWDDPHRLARLYLARRVAADGNPTLLQWRDEFHEWGGACWRPVPDSDLDAALARHCRAVFEADYPTRVEQAQLAAEEAGKEKPAKPPSLFKVTTRTRADVRLNLGGQANLPDAGRDVPFWLDDTPTDPAAVVAAPNGLFTLDGIAAGSGPFAAPSPRLFTPTALPFPVPADPETPAVWLRCLDEWFSGDRASIAGLQEWFAYLLSADTSQHKILFVVGPPRSGKGTILRILVALVGERNVASTTFAALGENFGLEDLLGKRVALVPDGRLSRRTDTAAVVERLLSISGEDPQSVNRKNRPRITTRLRTRFVIASNEVPRLPDASGALANRFDILVTPNSWLGKEDRGLGGRLLAELPGIFKWAAEGWVRLKSQGRFTPNEAAAQHARELADLSSPVRAFVRDACRVGPDCEVEIPTLFQAWRDWNGQRNREAGTEAVFGRDVRAALPHLVAGQRRDGDTRVRVYRGIALRPRREWGEDDHPADVARGGTRDGPTHAWVRDHPGGESGVSGTRVGPSRVPPRADTTTMADEHEAAERSAIDEFGGG